MKTISNIFSAVVALLCMASAQPADVGFLRIIHAVAPGTGKAAIVLNGRDLHPQGYELGQDTGGYGIKAGDQRVVVRKAGVETGTARFPVNPGETTTLVAFAERVPNTVADSPPRWEIRFLRLRPHDAVGGYSLSLVSVCQSEETVVDVRIEGRPAAQRVSARRLAITRTEAGPKAAEIGVTIDAHTLTHISADSPGNYVVILYENPEGKVQALSFYDAKFMVAG